MRHRFSIALGQMIDEAVSTGVGKVFLTRKYVINYSITVVDRPGDFLGY